MKMNRFQAFGWHLLGSACIALLSAGLVFLVWYPGALAAAVGVEQIFLLVLAVDVVIGPVITLIVFNPRKIKLRRDLAIVVALQIAALLYGLNTVMVARPVYMVFNVDRFDLVYANDLPQDKLDKVQRREFSSIPLFGPQIIAARRPDDPQERKKILFSALDGGDDLPQLPQYYVPYQDMHAEVAKHMYPLEKLRALNRSASVAVDSLLEKYAQVAGGVGYLPLKGKAKDKDMAVVIDRQSARVLEIVNLKPW